MVLKQSSRFLDQWHSGAFINNVYLISTAHSAMALGKAFGVECPRSEPED